MTEPTPGSAPVPGPQPAGTEPHSTGTGSPSTGTGSPPPAGTDVQARTADLVAGPGGVMTDEAGVVTGELTLRTELADGRVTLRVQYKDADEWYAVTGASAPLADPAAVDAVHAIALALLHRPEG